MALDEIQKRNQEYCELAKQYGANGYYNYWGDAWDRNNEYREQAFAYEQGRLEFFKRKEKFFDGIREEEECQVKEFTK